MGRKTESHVPRGKFYRGVPTVSMSRQPCLPLRRVWLSLPQGFRPSPEGMCRRRHHCLTSLRTKLLLLARPSFKELAGRHCACILGPSVLMPSGLLGANWSASLLSFHHSLIRRFVMESPGAPLLHPRGNLQFCFLFICVGVICDQRRRQESICRFSFGLLPLDLLLCSFFLHKD